MTIPSSALPPSPLREPVLSALQAQKNIAPARETAALDGVEKSSKPTSREKKEALDEINHSLKMASIGVRFEFDKEANTMITKVVDVESGEMIRQMPSEEVVRIAKAMNNLKGLLFAQAV